MSSVKQSEQYRMTVVPYRPWRRFFIVLFLVLVFAATATASFFAGQFFAVGTNIDLQAERNRLRVEVDDLDAQLNRLEQQKANLRLAAEVDRRANQEIRTEIVSLRNQLANLEQDNRFYRELMNPAPGEKGIIIDVPVVERLAGAADYKFNLIVKQIAARHLDVRGYIEFDLVGTQDGKKKRVALNSVSSEVEKEKIDIRFKYFQRLQGQMALPEGFVPSGIELKLVASKPKRQTINKKFAWVISEG